MDPFYGCLENNIHMENYGKLPKNYVFKQVQFTVDSHSITLSTRPSVMYIIRQPLPGKLRASKTVLNLRYCPRIKPMVLDTEKLT